jgi:hypothetical protein
MGVAGMSRSCQNKIKQRHRIATRYDKLAANYLAFIRLASIRILLRVNESMLKSKTQHGRNAMLARIVRGVALLLVACAGLARQANAETLLEHSAETRMQLDFVVSAAALTAFLPAGWETDVATSGGAKDCNLRLIFVDRIDITGPDDAPKGTSQLVYLEVPVKKPGASLSGRMVIDGLTADAKDAPGPFAVYKAATSHRMERSNTGAAGQPIQTTENWEFVGPNGERMELHLKYQRRVARRGTGEIKLFSAADPSFYQIVKLAQGLDPMRNATVPTRDTVSEFQYKGTGGILRSLFDGSERVVSIDSIHWNDRAIYLP